MGKAERAHALEAEARTPEEVTMASTNTDQPEATEPKPAPAPFYRRVSEIIRDPSEWQDIPQVEIDQLDGSEIVIHDVMFLRGDFDRADPDYAIVLFASPEDAPLAGGHNGRSMPVNARTTSCGGSVFVRKLKTLSGYGDDDAPSLLPILGRVVRRQSKAAGKPQPYYDYA